MQVGPLVGLWELFISADLREGESVAAWEGRKEQGLKDLLLRRAQLSPLAVAGCCCQGLCCDLCSYSKLRQLQVLVWCERGTWGLQMCLVKRWPFQPGLVDQEGLLPAPLVQAREELAAWCHSAVPASLLSAEGAGWGLLLTTGTRQNVCQGGPGHKEMIS